MTFCSILAAASRERMPAVLERDEISGISRTGIHDSGAGA
jgi:hypothetical protein